MLTVSYYHATYTFQSECTLYSCLNVKKLLARNRHDIWNISDSNWIRAHNNLGRKRIFNYLAKLAGLAKWLSVRLRAKWLCIQIPLLSLKWRMLLHPKNKINYFRRKKCYVTKLEKSFDIICQINFFSIAHHVLLFFYQFKHEKQLLSSFP